MMAVSDLTLVKGAAVAVGKVAVNGARKLAAKAAWDKARKSYWKTYSPTGKAPTRTVEVRSRKSGRVYQKEQTKELHHVDPQRSGGSNHPSNLQELWPNEHEAIDPFRNTGYDVTDLLGY
jgi:hypothetical protein